MKNAFIFHGTGAGPKSNWFPWLKSELEKLDFKVFIPQFPHTLPEDKLNLWMDEFNKYKKFVNKESIFIGHSKGSVFLYHLLPTLKIQISAVYLVCPWFHYHWYRKDKPVSTFHVDPFKWSQLKNTSQYFEIYQSTNDIISVNEGKKIAKDVVGKLIIVENAGHFNIIRNQEYIKFPLLLKNIKNHFKI